jgi:hypothetical protein
LYSVLPGAIIRSMPLAVERPRKINSDYLPDIESLKPGEAHVVLALGKNWNQSMNPIGKNRRELLSAESYMTAIGSAALALDNAAINTFNEKKKAQHILINSTGHTRFGFPTEAEAMRRAQVEQFSEIYRKLHFAFEEESIDTPGNMEEVSGMLADWRNTGLEITKISLVTVGFHLDRSLALAKRYNVPIDESYASEDLISNYFYVDKNFTQIYRSHDWHRKQEKLESILHLALKIDPFDGRVFPRILTQRIRK